jgi:NAD(P)-dependent dehydrogenase (short-subunit alcohol dehydrogenase family)
MVPRPCMRSRRAARSICSSRMWRLWSAHGRQCSTLGPAIVRFVVSMNLFGTVYSRNAVAPVMKQQRSGKIITVSSVAGKAPPPIAATPLRCGQSSHRALHEVSGPGSRTGQDRLKPHCPGVIATGPIMTQAVIPGSSRSDRDRAELVALRRLGTVQDFAKGGRVPGDRPVRLCDRCGDPDRRRLGARIASPPLFPWVSASSSIVDTGIELSRSPRLLPMELNGDAC